MSTHLHEFGAREGGEFRVSLSCNATVGTGKSALHTDTHDSHFVKLLPDEQAVEAFEFETADPALCGTLTTTLTDAGGGTDVLVAPKGIPDGVPAAENETGTRMALANLAQLVHHRSGTGYLRHRAHHRKVFTGETISPWPVYYLAQPAG